MLTDLTQSLNAGMDLDEISIKQAVEALTGEVDSTETKAAFLLALAQKGERFHEIAGFARQLRSLSVPVPLEDPLKNQCILDVCGTGGDHQNTFNISTAVALLLASTGIPVAKHGNRAVTSKSGSADVLDALGIPTDLNPEQAAQSLAEHHFAFFFAPRYHPAFKNIMPARKLCAEQGKRTLFNFLGPLLNPAGPTAQIIGVPQPALTELICRALQSSGVNRGMVVCGHANTGFMDEISITGPTTLHQYLSGDVKPVAAKLDPTSLPLCRKPLMSDLQGGTASDNATIIRQILSGEEKGPKRDIVLINAAAALHVAGKAETMESGWKMALEAIQSGQSAKTLDRVSRS